MSAEENQGYQSTHDRERHSDLAVLDANTYKNKRRLERILDALDNIPDQADRAREEYTKGEIHLHARRIAVQDAVNDAIWEAWNLLKDHERGCRERAGEAYLEYAAEQDHDIDPNRYDPAAIDPETLREAYQAIGVWPHSRYFIGHPAEPPLGTIEQSREDDITVVGLQDFHDLDEQWTETWTERHKPYNLPPRTVTREVNHTVPLEISWNAAIRLKEFLNDQHDMEIQFEAIDDSRPYDDWREEFESGEYTGPDSVDLPHKDV